MLKYPFILLKKISFFILLLAITNGYAESHKIPEIITYAKQYRLDPQLTPEQEQVRLKGTLAQAYKILPHYEVTIDLKDSIKSFVNDTLSMEIQDVSEFSIIDTRTTEFYGKSHDLVFLINDKAGHERYVVKAFENPCLLSGRFLPEISAMVLIREMRLPSITPIEPIAAAICHEGQKEWGLLLESAATGHRMDQYILALAKDKADLKTHQQTFEAARVASLRFGESLAFLHSVKSAEKMPLHPSILSKYDEKLNRVLKEPFIVEELSKCFSLSQLIDYVMNVKNEALTVTLFYTFAHGDTNLGNIFYDDLKNSISFIDLYALHQSVDIKGQPLSDPIIDLVRAEDAFRKTALNILTENELEILLSSFYNSYQHCGGSIPDNRHLNFYKTYINLWRLILGSHYIVEQDPIRRDFDKATFEEGIEYFTKEIK